jgi:hypothetical protein
MRSGLSVGIAWLLLALGTGCKSTNDLAACDASAATEACPEGESCLWVNAGNESRYACVRVCAADAGCPAGTSCQVGGAAGCMTCMSLVDVCLP